MAHGVENKPLVDDGDWRSVVVWCKRSKGGLFYCFLASRCCTVSFQCCFIYGHSFPGICIDGTSPRISIDRLCVYGTGYKTGVLPLEMETRTRRVGDTFSRWPGSTDRSHGPAHFGPNGCQPVGAFPTATGLCSWAETKQQQTPNPDGPVRDLALRGGD